MSNELDDINENDMTGGSISCHENLIYDTPILDNTTGVGDWASGGSITDEEIKENNIEGGFLNKDEYETLLFEHDFQKETLVKALNIVKQFIIDESLILVGGMAIDFSLRLKGEKLYEDNKFPDYDFYSPIFHIHAYKLGQLLVDHGMENISVIRGKHVSTMRVRINFITVADITYIPENIFKKLPTMEYNIGEKQIIKIIHPHYQMIDQHRSLSLPLENPPQENAMSRWKKDQERFTLLYNHYKIENIEIKDFKTVNVNLDMTKERCINGAIALAFWFRKASLINKKYGTEIYTSSLIFEDSLKEIKAVIPEKLSIVLYVNDIESFESKDITMYNPVVDKLPARKEFTIKKDKYKIYDTFGSLLSAYNYKNMYIANLQAIMEYFLTWGILYGCHPSLWCYNEALKLLISINNLDVWDKGNVELLDELELFQPSIQVYGIENISDSSFLIKEDILVFFKEKEKTIHFPKNSYPTKDKPTSKELYDFKPSEQKIYQYDGLQHISSN